MGLISFAWEMLRYIWCSGESLIEGDTRALSEGSEGTRHTDTRNRAFKWRE